MGLEKAKPDWATQAWFHSSWACSAAAAISAAICLGTFAAWLSPWAIDDQPSASLGAFAVIFLLVVAVGVALTVPQDHRRAAIVQAWVDRGGPADDPARRMVLNEPWRQGA